MHRLTVHNSLLRMLNHELFDGIQHKSLTIIPKNRDMLIIAHDKCRTECNSCVVADNKTMKQVSAPSGPVIRDCAVRAQSYRGHRTTTSRNEALKYCFALSSNDTTYVDVFHDIFQWFSSTEVSQYSFLFEPTYHKSSASVSHSIS